MQLKIYKKAKKMETELKKIKIGKSLGTSVFKSDKSCDFTVKNERKSLFLSGFDGGFLCLLGKALSEKLECPLYNVNLLIEQQLDMPIKEMVSKLGETYFRAVEHSYIDKLAREKGIVAICGAGAMLTEKNYKTAKRNGVVIYADEKEPYDNFAIKLQRPLHLRHADIVVQKSADILEVSKEILSKI